MVELVNLQQTVSVDLVRLYSRIRRLKAVAELKGRKFSVALVSDARMTELNKLFRGKDSTTDVLSFPYEADEFDPDKNNLGDIVISAEQAEKQAGENGLTVDGEIMQLVLHGVLHLCGYDHETDDGEMDAREIELRDKLAL